MIKTDRSHHVAARRNHVNSGFRAGLLLLIISTYAATSSSAQQGGSEFKSLAKQIISRINRSGGTEEWVGASKGAHTGVSRWAHSLSFDGASVSSDGYFRVSMKDKSYNINNAKPDRNPVVGKIIYRLPLAKVNKVSIDANYLRPSNFVSGSSYGSKYAQEKTKSIYILKVATEGRDVSRKYDSFSAYSQDNAEIAAFQTRAEAVQFAKDFHRLATMLRGEGRVALKL